MKKEVKKINKENKETKRTITTIANGYILLLSIFIAFFYILNEYLDLALSPAIVLPLVVIITVGIVLVTRKGKVSHDTISNYVALPVIIFDGFFHLTSPLENLVENSPDWVIAFNVFQGNGMPVIVHQLMGVLLLLTSGWFIYLLISKKKNWAYYFYKYVIAVITLTIISFSYLIKLFK